MAVSLNSHVTFNSDSKGRAAHLLKASSKKKRSREELEEVKEEESKLNENKHEFLHQHKRLREANQHLQDEVQRHRKNEILLNNLYEQGVIDDAGQPVMPMLP